MKRRELASVGRERMRRRRRRRRRAEQEEKEGRRRRSGVGRSRTQSGQVRRAERALCRAGRTAATMS
jgi:hypothetical protein